MSKITIYLKYESGELKYSYSESNPFKVVTENTTTKVRAGDEVEWVCAEGSQLNSIEINRDSGDNVFSVDPHPVANPDGSLNEQCWTGQTKNNISHSESEKYDIKYIPNGEDSSYIIDPVIDLEPDGEG